MRCYKVSDYFIVTRHFRLHYVISLMYLYVEKVNQSDSQILTQTLRERKHIPYASKALKPIIYNDSVEFNPCGLYLKMII